MALVKPRYPSPFYGILGSFEEIYVDDLFIRFNAFYQELINSLDFEKALVALQIANPGLPDDYRYISAEQTFKKVYQKYFDSEFTLAKIESRFKEAVKKEGIKFTDQNIKNKFYNHFRAILQRSKKDFFENDKATFFMFERFPGHKYIYCCDWEPDYNRS